MKLTNPFKHKHDIDHICHCYQIMCRCRKHLWEIIKNSEKEYDSDGKLTAFKLNGSWYSILGIIGFCKKEGYRFYCEELGEVQTGWAK